MGQWKDMISIELQKRKETLLIFFDQLVIYFAEEAKKFGTKISSPEGEL